MQRRLSIILLIFLAVSWPSKMEASSSNVPEPEMTANLDLLYAPIQHTVAMGDTLSEIAIAHNIDVATLAEYNNLADPSVIVVGQVIKIPSTHFNGVLPLATELPTEPEAETIVPAGTSVVLVIDNTGSMAGANFQRVIAETQNLLDELDPASPVAVVTYSDTAEVTYPFTTDHAYLQRMLGQMRASGDAALYDGALIAAQEAARAETEQAVVILLTDGKEYRGISRAQREDALNLVEEEGIPFITVALGSEADVDYLEALSEITGSEVFTAATSSELGEIFATIADSIENLPLLEAETAPAGTVNIPPILEDSISISGLANEMASSLLNASFVDRLFSSPGVPIPDSGDSTLMIPLPGASAASASEEIELDDETIAQIPPIVDELRELNLDEAAAPAEETDLVPEIEPNVPDAGQVDIALAEDLTSNVMPISITVDPSINVEMAELAINGYRLATFDQPPFQYDLDTSLLDQGLYNMTFTILNAGEVVSVGTLEFEVVILEEIMTGDGTGESAGELDVNAVEPYADVQSPAVQPLTVSLDSASADEPIYNETSTRVLLIDGKRQHFDFEFNSEVGLTPRVPEAEVLVEPSQTLLDILKRPANNLIPEPVRQVIFQPRPHEAGIVILIMTLTLLPQGLFTIYWMMYSWNYPKIIERSQSPREFAAPKFSFTALLPARHEEDVIKQTIYAVDRIQYPEHLKEVLILCRDDDQGTIAKAREAVAEIGKPNIRVVTFSTGPINKPHALNIGLREATKEVIAVFDAEDEPHHELYNVINTVMLRDDADVVQSGVQLMNFRSTWFSALNVLEYFFWFKSGLHCFTHKFKVTPLGGNTVFFKRHHLERIGGWDENCLTEDADVGIRLTQLGAKIQIVYDAEHATQEETPATVESFIKQRTRWNQGFYQVFFKGDWLKLPELKQRITAIYILLNSLLQAAVILYLPVGLFIALTQQVSVPIALFSYLPIYLLLMQLITSLIGIREFTEAYGLHLPLGFRLRMALYYYPYQLLLTVAAARAVFRFLSQNQAWEKTAHANLHRQGQVLGKA